MPQLSKAGAFTLLAVSCLTIMVGCVIVPGLPRITQHLGATSYAGWLVTMPSLGVVIFGPIAGRMIDRTGLRNSLCVGLFLYGLLGVAAMFLTGPVLLLLDRLLLGGATALVMSAGTGLISVFYDGQARMSMIARQGMSIEFGGVIFLFVGGLLATVGWQFPFFLYLVAWIMLAMVVLFVPEHSNRAIETVQGNASPIDGSLRLVFFAAFFSMVIFFTGIIELPLRFHQLDINEAQTGYFLSFVSLVAVGAAANMPRLATRLGEHKTLCAAFVLYAIGHAVFSAAQAMPLLVVGAVAMGCGFGLSVPLVNHMTVEQSKTQQRGRNLAYLSMAIFSGQFVSSFMNYVPGSFQHVFQAAACMALLVTVALTVAHKSLRHSAA